MTDSTPPPQDRVPETDGGAGRPDQRARDRTSPDSRLPTGDRTSPDDWRPTRTSTALVLGTSVVLAAILAVQVAPVAAVGLVAVDAMLVAGSLWLIDRERWRVVAVATAAAATVLVGAVFALAVGYTALSLVASLFPVHRLARASTNGLTVLSSTLVVAGAGLAMAGAFTAVGNHLREETVRDYADLAGKAFVVPAAFSLVSILTTGFSDLGGAETAPPVFRVLGSLLSLVVGAVLTPGPSRLHLFTFAALLGIACESLSRALTTLPADQLTSREASPIETVVAVSARIARWLALVGLFVLPVGVVAAFTPPQLFVELLSPPTFRSVAAITTNHTIRWLLLWCGVLSLLTLAATTGVQRVARMGTRQAVVALAPLAGGLVVVALTALGHRPLLEAGIGFVEGALPGVFATQFEAQTSAVLSYYGSFTAGVTLSALLVLLSALLATGTWLVIRAEYLPSTVTPPALASVGVFVAAAFAGASGVAAPLVVAGVVAAIVVWDVGEFGVTLGREIGRVPRTRGTELVHLSSSVAVGFVGVAGTAGVFVLARTDAVTELTTVPFAVVGVAVGLVFLFVALR